MNILGFDNIESDIAGTCLQGRIEATYDEVVSFFGEPTYYNGDKTNVEWNIEFTVEEDGDTEIITATLYDWKEMDTPTGRYLWHIGGFDHRAVDCMYDVMEDTITAPVAL